MPKPNNTTLVQIGFLYPLNYPFVANTPGSQNQIFGILPGAIAYGLGVDNSSVRIHSLQPYDTRSTLGYITTVAMVFIPSSMVDTLMLDLHTPASKMYNNPNAETDTLMSMINASLPVLASLNGGTVDGASDPTALPANANGAPLGNDGGGTSTVKGSSVGIGVGVIAGAAAYGAAMFWVARRYTRKKQSHTRSPSMTESTSHPSGNYGSMMRAGALMSGGRAGAYQDDIEERNSRGTGSSNGRSARAAGISAPVMAENSLGWH